MIENTFIHFPGIGPATERKLWEQGIRTWDDLEVALEDVFRAKRASALAPHIEESREALASGEFRYFSQKLKSRDAWRLLPHIQCGIAYLDIETTGLGFPPESHSTSIAVMLDGELLVEHESERRRELVERLNSEAQLFVTFNGLGFDLPFLRREFDLTLDQPHVDLCVWFRRHDVRGGLKLIQASFPHVRQRSSMDIDGFDAVKLYRMHKQGVPHAMETLMTYNAEDTVCLEPLLREAYKLEKGLYHSDREVTFALPEIEPLNLPEIKTQVDPFVYALLRGEERWDLPPEW